MEMKFVGKVMTCVVVLIAFMLSSSCVNEEYELSEEHIDLDITVFQEGISLPLGSTERVTLESLYSQLGDDVKDIIQELEGAYMFRMSDSLDMTQDIVDALSGIGSLDAVSMNMDFMFGLDNVDLSGIGVSGRKIGPETIDVSDMLSKLDVETLNEYLPAISKDIPTIRVSVPKPDADGLALDLSSIADDLDKETVIARLGTSIALPDEALEHELAEMEMNYPALVAAFPTLGLPEMITNFVFDPYTVEVPVRFTLPKEIKSVKDIRLHPDASFELVSEILNPLFTSGTITPEIDLDLHHLLNIDYVKSGMVEGTELEYVDPDGDGMFEQHIKDKFAMSPENGWKSDHVYHVESLVLNDEDWKLEGENLVLDKVVPITMSGELVVQETDLKTTLKHLAEYGNEPMKIRLDIRFIDFNIDDVQMEIESISTSETLEVPLKIEEVDLGTDLVEKIDYVAFNQDSPLFLKMNASLPEMFKSLDINLKTLKIEFPEGLVVSNQNGSGYYDQATNTLSYENVSLTEGLDERIVVEKVSLPALVDNKLAYDGKIKVFAEAAAEGILSSKELMAGESGDITIDVSVAFEPKVVDYAVTIRDYTYDVEFDPMVINTPISKELGEMLAEEPVLVAPEKDALGQNPTISIRLDYPQHPAIRILPKAGEGLKIDFPDMLRFSPASVKDSYNFDADGNTMTFTGEDTIPSEITLVIDKIEVVAENIDGNYFVNDLMTVTGGVRLAGTTIHKSDVDDLQKDAVITFEGEIPDIRPAEFGLDEYEKVIEEEIVIEAMEVEIPDMIKSMKIEEILLKDVYLDLAVDASSVREKVGDVDVTLTLDVELPEMFLVESTDANVSVSENNVLQVKTELAENGMIAVNGVHVVGFDLSEVAVEDGKLTVDVGKLPVTGSILLKNLKVNVDDLKDVDIELSIKGGLASRNEKGELSESILIDKVMGYVGLEIDPVDVSVDLSSVAETLNNDNMSVTLDVNTFYLTLDVNTNIDIPLSGTLEVTPYYGGTAGERVERPITLEPQQRKDDYYGILVSNMEPGSPEAGGRYDAYKDYQYIELDLVSMLYKKEDGKRPVVADSINVTLNAGVDPEKLSTIEPNKAYVLSAEYEVGVPMELGEDFAFEYRDTLSGLPEIVNQLLAYGSVGLGGKVTSSLPLRLDLQVNLLDSLDRVIPMKEGAGRMEIASCDAKGNPVISDIDLVIGVDGVVETGIKAVELVFKADAKGAVGVPFGPDNFIMAELNAMIPDGISLDGWEFVDMMGEDEDNQN